MNNTTTTSVLKANIDPFKAFTLSTRGTRAYWAVTWLQSDTPNGRYEIEKLSNTMWVATHHQVLANGNDKIVRRVDGLAAKTKREAIAQCERDSANLAANVMAALLAKPTVNAMCAQKGLSA